MLGLSAAFLLNQKYVNSAIMLVITATLVVIPINQTWMRKEKTTNTNNKE
jgi:UDP-GlcNAc:undecaprenyl-phosphate GlcNAc-1-phosphate transferase